MQALLKAPHFWLLVTLMAAVVSDLRARRIPNALIAGGLVIAFACQVSAQGLPAGLASWLGGLATGFGLFIGIYLLRGMGAGDVKLMALAGAYVGAAQAFHIAIATILVGGVLAVAMIVFKRQTRRSSRRLVQLLTALTGTGSQRIRDLDDPRADKHAHMPYAVAIAGGALLVLTGAF